MSTFIDGIGQCEVVDKSSEVVSLKGHDISSLDKTGTFTWEHQANSPATLVGKILKAKKIFSKDDCENDRELYYWNKCKAPYLYVMGELLDDYTASARECAGQMRYSKDNPDKHPLLGFSVEGSEIPNTRKGMVITRSIARKITLTQSPCNSACIAEIYEAPEQKSSVKDDFEELFRSEQEAMDLMKSDQGLKIYEDYLAKKESEPPSTTGKSPKSPAVEYQGLGIRPGRNSSGEAVYSHGNTRPYSFNPAEHQHQGEYHHHAIVTAQNPKLGNNKEGRHALHSVATESGGRVENRTALSLKDRVKISSQQGKEIMTKSIGLTKSGKDVYSHDSADKYDFTPDEHKEAAEHHRHAAVTANSSEEADHHIEQMKNHNRASLAKSETKKIKKVDVSSAPGLFNKKEPLNWSPGKVDKEKGTVTYHHPEHGPLTIQKQPNGDFHVKHHGAIAGVGGVKGIFSNPKEAGSHARKYMEGVSRGTVLPNRPHNKPSPAMMGKSESKPLSQMHPNDLTPGNMYNIGHKSGQWAKYNRSTPAAHHFTVGDKVVQVKRNTQPELKKAIEAGSYNAAPSTLVNGAAYQCESMSPSQTSTGMEDHTFQGTKKKDWNKRAKEDYENWPYKEKFEKFMQARMPHLKLGEIRALGRVLALKKSLNFENALDNLVLCKSEETKKEIESKSLHEIQAETAEKWADRAEESYKKAIEDKSVKWLLESEELFHEAIEHSCLSDDVTVFEKIKKQLMSIREEALKLLAPGYDK
jgi:hypothetical protein